MAVTVTVAAPSRSVDKIYQGSYGLSDSSVSVGVNAEGLAQKRLRCAKLTLSSTYVTGGFALVPSAYGLKEIHGLMVVCDANSSSGGAAVPQLTTTGASPIVKLYTDNVPTELANTTSVANHTYTVLIVGV